MSTTSASRQAATPAARAPAAQPWVARSGRRESTSPRTSASELQQVVVDSDAGVARRRRARLFGEDPEGGEAAADVQHVAAAERRQRGRRGETRPLVGARVPAERARIGAELAQPARVALD